MNKKIILILIVSSICLLALPGAYSFYNSTAIADSNVLVANFKPKLNGSVNLNQTINLRDTVSNSYTNPYLEPGTSGVIELNLDFTKADISADYIINLGTYNLPNNLKFYTDSAHTNLFNSFNGTYSINGTTSFNHNIYWYWEAKNDPDSVANDANYANIDLEVPIAISMNKKVKASYDN